MTVQAKFVCQEMKHLHTADPNSVYVEIRLTAVYGTGKENESWSKATPSGEIKMSVTNPAAIEKFELGKSYLITFEEFPEPQKK